MMLYCTTLVYYLYAYCTLNSIRYTVYYILHYKLSRLIYALYHTPYYVLHLYTIYTALHAHAYRPLRPACPPQPV